MDTEEDGTDLRECVSIPGRTEHPLGFAFVCRCRTKNAFRFSVRAGFFVGFNGS